MVVSDLEVVAKAKTQIDDNSGVLNVQPSPLHDTKLDVKGNSVEYQESNNCLHESLKVKVAAITISEASNKAEDVGRSFKVVNVRKDGSEDESPVDHLQHKRDSGDSEDSRGIKKSSTGFGPDEPSQSSGIILSSAVALGECKAVVPGANSSSASPAVLISQSSACENHMTASVQSREMDTKQAGISESSPADNKVNGSALTEVVKDEDSNTKKSVKELAKSSLSYVSKSSQAKKVLHATVSKRTLTDSKESMLHSASKPSPMSNVTATPCSELANVVQTESSSNLEKKASALQTENASNTQKKVTGSILSQKGEKINQSVYQSSSKGNTTLTHTATSSNSPATLSDEELALLLHQELNSSPRVPRVPRMRHAGSLPQLTSPTATSMLMKRTSSTGGKDHSLTSRRKTKDLAKDGSHGSREIDDETRKMDRVLPSSDHGRQGTAFGPDSVTKREADTGSAKGLHFMEKSNVSASGPIVSSSLSSPSEANEHLSPIRHSPRNPSDDDKGVIGRPTHRTLPGLIAEIMSKGKRMTYEELCNAVLPHWPNLRKHNGERYAYSSHSQAVLDCLRNRNEWARLVDRGPKTSGGRKRRKLDADTPGIDSEDNDDSRDRAGKDIRSKSIDSHHEEFPKGKRKARKRRRLALQGRGIKDVRRRRRIEELSDNDVGSFSNSSEETVLSEDETEGGGISAAGNEVSASSDGTGNS